MLRFSKTLLVLFGLGMVTASRAQTSVRLFSSHLLGQRTFEIAAGVFDARGTSDARPVFETSVNLPLRRGWDLGIGCAHYAFRDHIGAFVDEGRDQALFATATGFVNAGKTKPFFAAGLGYEWTKNELSYGGTRLFRSRDSDVTWRTSLGVEIPFSRVTITPSLSYRDSFRGDFFRIRRACLTVGLDAHFWITKSFGSVASVTFIDSRETSYQAWTYLLGARIRF